MFFAWERELAEAPIQSLVTFNNFKEMQLLAQSLSKRKINTLPFNAPKKTASGPNYPALLIGLDTNFIASYAPSDNGKGAVYKLWAGKAECQDFENLDSIVTAIATALNPLKPQTSKPAARL